MPVGSFDGENINYSVVTSFKWNVSVNTAYEEARHRLDSVANICFDRKISR
jgi:hypothetical protein